MTQHIPFDKIVKVKFLKPNEDITSSVKTHEIEIEFTDLIKLINDVEEKRGLGAALHKEAYTGTDYLGQSVKFNCYVIWTVDPDQIFKFNFSEELVPFGDEILRRKRDTNIDSIL